MARHTACQPHLDRFNGLIVLKGKQEATLRNSLILSYRLVDGRVYYLFRSHQSLSLVVLSLVNSSSSSSYVHLVSRKRTNLLGKQPDKGTNTKTRNTQVRIQAMHKIIKTEKTVP